MWTLDIACTAPSHHNPFNQEKPHLLNWSSPCVYACQPTFLNIRNLQDTLVQGCELDWLPEAALKSQKAQLSTLMWTHFPDGTVHWWWLHWHRHSTVEAQKCKISRDYYSHYIHVYCTQNVMGRHLMGDLIVVMFGLIQCHCIYCCLGFTLLLPYVCVSLDS